MTGRPTPDLAPLGVDEVELGPAFDELLATVATYRGA